jgi:hypothetical protein
MTHRGRIAGLVRLLYTQNPFYLISAALILYGIFVAFHSDGAGIDDPWLLAATLCGYTTLMAATAIAIIKFGRVWQDARSIALILLFQFVAISMSFDQVCATSFSTAVSLQVFGFGFSLLISEMVLGVLHIRFPLLYRGPYYLILGLFFFYPLWVSPDASYASSSVVMGRVYLFPAISGLTFLSLLPAIRRGNAYIAKNGTPWPWPLYPWTVFVFLGFGVCMRSYALSQSFNVLGLQNSFGGYYLVPFFLAVLILLLEASIRGTLPRLQRMTLLAAPLLLVLSLPGDGNRTYLRFLGMLQANAGSPVWMTLVALVAFYTYGHLRRVRFSETGALTSLVLLCFVGRNTIDWSTLESGQWWPLALVGTVQFVQSVGHRSSLRCFTAAVAWVVAVCLGMRENALLMYGGVIPIHVLLGAGLVIGIVFRDTFALVLRRMVGVSAVVAAVLAVCTLDCFSIGDTWRLLYLAVLAALGTTCWICLRDRTWLLAGIANTGSAILVANWICYWRLLERLGSGVLTPIAWGVACFLIAILISALKGGLWQRVRTRLMRVGLPDT